MRQLRPALRLTQLAAASGLLFAGAAAQAQDAAPNQLDTVVVTGIRASMESSVGLKRNAHGVVDGIVAEDIGKFPDTNLAEAMQRISGVSIDRTASGEGSKVTVRGIGPDYNLVLLNGRQMPGSSLQDTSASSSRSFDFANLAAESVSALEVYKTSRASSPTGGMGATINIRTARPLELGKQVASFGVKLVKDQSNTKLPVDDKGKSVTPEVSGIYSNVFADGMFGVTLSGSFQRRDSGYNQAGVTDGWRSFMGSTNDWGTIPQTGSPGGSDITNRPKATDVYSVPQNLDYSTTGVQRKRTNGQVVLQFAPNKDLTTTLDYTYSENKILQRRNDISAWFNFGPSISTWTNGPAAAPLIYSETIVPATSDIAMGGSLFATKNENKSLGFNANWKATKSWNVELDAHSSSATSSPNSPYGSNNILGTATFNRGTTTANFSQDFPVLSIAGPGIDASKNLVTGSSFRNSYMRDKIDQIQLRNKYKIDDVSELDFGLAATRVNNRSAYANVDTGTWGGATSAADYPDSLWHPDTLAKYFSNISGSNNPAMFNQWFTFNFDQVRDIAAKVGTASNYVAPTDYTTDRRTKENSKSLYAEYQREWEWGVPMSGVIGMRYESTDVTSRALVPTPTGVSWGSNNEYTVLFGPSAFTELKGKYSYWLPSIDLDADLTSRDKLRLSFGEAIGRPGWGDIQGGQTLDGLARINGGTGSQGNPGLKPLLSKNWDFSIEHYYAKGSYMALGLFRKDISNYIGTSQVSGTPFGIHTPSGGALFNAAISQGCVNSDITCIRNYILNNFSGTQGVTKTGVDVNGNATGTIVGQASDPVMSFLINVPSNQKKANLSGVEINFQHTFDSGFGLFVNYTKVRSNLKYNDNALGEQFAIEGLSDSANLVGFFENKFFETRLAYNWRGKFLSSRFDGVGPNPVYTAPYGQLDWNAAYKFDERFSVQFEVINLTNQNQRLYERATQETAFVTQTGRRFMIGARYKF